MARPPAEESDNATATDMEIAVRLLELQQRMTAFGSLYDEEITDMSRELSRLKADFIRHCQTCAPKTVAPVKSKRANRKRSASQRMRKAPDLFINDASDQKE